MCLYKVCVSALLGNWRGFPVDDNQHLLIQGLYPPNTIVFMSVKVNGKGNQLMPKFDLNVICILCNSLLMLI